MCKSCMRLVRNTEILCQQPRQTAFFAFVVWQTAAQALHVQLYDMYNQEFEHTSTGTLCIILCAWVQLTLQLTSADASTELLQKLGRH